MLIKLSSLILGVLIFLASYIEYNKSENFEFIQELDFNIENKQFNTAILLTNAINKQENTKPEFVFIAANKAQKNNTKVLKKIHKKLNNNSESNLNIVLINNFHNNKTNPTTFTQIANKITPHLNCDSLDLGNIKKLSVNYGDFYFNISEHDFLNLLCCMPKSIISSEEYNTIYQLNLRNDF